MQQAFGKAPPSPSACPPCSCHNLKRRENERMKNTNTDHVTMTLCNVGEYIQLIFLCH